MKNNSCLQGHAGGQGNNEATEDLGSHRDPLFHDRWIWDVQLQQEMKQLMIKTDPQLKGNTPLERAAESMSHFTLKTVANDIAALLH